MNRLPIVAHPRSVVALDLIRGLAAFCVFFAHIRGSSFVPYGDLPIAQRTPLVAALFAVSRLGGEAVLTFFVLSGFLVGGQLISRVRDNSFDLRLYAIDRVTRILLPLIPVCCLTAAINVVVFHQPFAVGELIGNMIGLNGVVVGQLPHDAPLWTLPFEIWFYVAGGGAACLFVARRKATQAIALGVVILAAAVFTVLPARFLLYWVIGAFTVLFLDTRGKTGLGVLGAIVLACGVVLRQLAIASDSVTPVILIPNATAEMLICGGFYLMLPLLCSERMNTALQFLRKPAAAFAGISFTLYLAHAPINSLADLFLPKAPNISTLSLAHFLLRCGICLVASIVLYWLFERNTTTLRRYLKARTRRAPERSAGQLSGSGEAGGHIAPRLR